MNEAQRLFYHAVLIVGAQVAMADGNPDSSELKQLKNFFNIDPREVPEAATIYNGQLHNPVEIEEALNPFKDFFSQNTEVAESFLVGMCLVSKADGSIHENELAYLSRIARTIGLSEISKERVFVSTGVETESRRRHDEPHSQDQRTQKLAVLGLLSDASMQDIKEEYRRLAKRYHPDVLRSKGLPEAEVRHAKALMVEINLAYEWLKENAQN